jgi:NAD(P)-dependent dehydrogenase (short-subunit alcohol dehydrogenase family)
VNAAGTIAAAPVHELEVEVFDEILATNLRGAFLLCRAVLPGMRQRGRGIIVNVSSVAARRAFSGMGAYGASKAALGALGAVIREENRALGVRVLDVVLGATRTPIWQRFWAEAPLERMMDPEEVARTVVSVLSFDGAAMVEELVLRAQGGDL